MMTKLGFKGFFTTQRTTNIYEHVCECYVIKHGVDYDGYLNRIMSCCINIFKGMTTTTTTNEHGYVYRKWEQFFFSNNMYLIQNLF